MQTLRSQLSVLSFIFATFGLRMSKISDVLERQRRSAFVPDAVISTILDQLTTSNITMAKLSKMMWQNVMDQSNSHNWSQPFPLTTKLDHLDIDLEGMTHPPNDDFNESKVTVATAVTKCDPSVPDVIIRSTLFTTLCHISLFQVAMMKFEV
ncbi:hypothetical protein KIN20_005747 [Parelaphostrongylus tenuis]|uniref:Uncharacterized protein n=1 Tax=Parelaphostrongylus tenuis TaxID=148309 RepID=A0AAD5MLJ7_PARTN|nr:hypothetical protein KIN20_005747 [Parelaphostrongylus tenuis]